MDKIWYLILMFIPSSSYAAGTSGNCCPPQNVSLGKGHGGIIQLGCHDSEWLYWYFGADISEERLVIFVDDSGKHYGRGFSSGEYDIYENGSLLITNVSLAHRGLYSVNIVELGSHVPRTEICNVDVYEPERADIMRTSSPTQTSVASVEEKITTDKLEPAVTQIVRISHGQDLEMVDIKSFQLEIDQLKRMDRTLLALLVFVLAGTYIVLWRSFTANMTKNPKCEEEGGQCLRELKGRLLVTCRGSCQNSASEPKIS